VQSAVDRAAAPAKSAQKRPAKRVSEQ